jgi:hypothetical protein
VAHQAVLVATTAEAKPFLGRSATRSTLRTNLYDAITGTWWRSQTTASEGTLLVGELVPVDLTSRVPPVVPAGRVAEAIRHAARRRDAAVGAAARDRWVGELEVLGVPGDAVSVTVERTETIYWPFWLGLLTTSIDARLVVVDGAGGAVCPSASDAFTAGLGHVLRSLGDAPVGSSPGRHRPELT